ncbi:MAG: S46 family peptidase [Bacteroidetes bacterium]|nr:S46 family peptidase [Bacteroidota bacterium]
MKKLSFLFLFILALRVPVIADEGMWIPMLLEKLNIKQMQDLGLKLSAEDIYSINHASLKDAIVQFGGGCTAEFVSGEGLLFTNHHCGLGTIQRLSSPDHDYLTDGFWAKSKEEELPCPGLTVTMLVSMEDVTDKVLQNVTDAMPEYQRSEIIRKNMAEVEKNVALEPLCEAKIRPFYYGNQYYLFITKTFRDVRLVGAPPSGIGQFGGDTDNWMWPRHGGDFSIFRVYVNKDNQPVEFSKDNIAYKPKKFLPVSLKGYKEGDFTFVFGYPGSTREYLTSWGVDLIADCENPIRINLRQERLDIFNEAMNQSKLVRIQYTSKHQGIANGWKKMMGETKGIKRMDAVKIKQDYEKKFQAWADSVGSKNMNIAKNPVSGLLPSFEKTYRDYKPFDIAATYLTEAGMGIEIVRFADGFADLVKKSKNRASTKEDIDKAVQKLKGAARTFYKDYQPAIDKKVFAIMIKEMKEKMDPKFLPSEIATLGEKYKNDYSACAENYFSLSVFPDSARLNKFLRVFESPDYKKLEKDPLYILSESIYGRYLKDVIPQTKKYTAAIDSLQRFYMAAQMAMGRWIFYPDANSTLRITYGKVQGFKPADAVKYNYFTTSTGILQKEDSSIYDYAIHPKLKKLFLDKDFGPYADRDGTLHVAFIGTNHTSGGNSGSPVLDATGNLIGLNFDRNWEGTMSDLMYDPDQCRNITLDIRYCLFVIDKFAGSKRLIDELNIIR